MIASFHAIEDDAEDILLAEQRNALLYCLAGSLPRSYNQQAPIGVLLQRQRIGKWDYGRGI